MQQLCAGDAQAMLLNVARSLLLASGAAGAVILLAYLGVGRRWEAMPPRLEFWAGRIGSILGVLGLCLLVLGYLTE